MQPLLAFKAIKKQLNPNILVDTKGHSLSANLCRAQKQLKQVYWEAETIRKQHLEVLLNHAIASNQHKKTKTLAYLIHAECNKQYYARFWHHTKPKSPGWLAYAKTPQTDGTTQTLLDWDEMEETLLEHSCMHFAKVDGSIFTNPMFTLHHFDKPVQDILSNLWFKVPFLVPWKHVLNYKTLMNNIKNCLSTSWLPLLVDI